MWLTFFLGFLGFFPYQNSTSWFIYINGSFLGQREQDKQFKLKGSYCSLAVFVPHLQLCPYFWVPKFQEGLIIQYFWKIWLVKPDYLMMQNYYCTVFTLKSGNSEKGKKKPSLMTPASNWASQWLQCLAIFNSPFWKQWKYVCSYITLVKF